MSWLSIFARAAKKELRKKVFKAVDQAEEALVAEARREVHLLLTSGKLRGQVPDFLKGAYDLEVVPDIEEKVTKLVHQVMAKAKEAIDEAL